MNWIPDKDILGSPLRYEGLRCEEYWTPDNNILGSSLRYEGLRCATRVFASLREAVLRAALGLDVFSVIDEPVNMSILREQLNRLFIKKYNNDIFAE